MHAARMRELADMSQLAMTNFKVLRYKVRINIDGPKSEFSSLGNLTVLKTKVSIILPFQKGGL